MALLLKVRERSERAAELMEAKLTSILGIVPLRDSVLTIGRSPNSGLFVNHTGISRHHAEIRPSRLGYSIVDLGSTSGTFVNGERLDAQAPRLLYSGDTIQVGNFPCLYEEKSPSLLDDLPPPPPARPSSPDWPLFAGTAGQGSGTEHVSALPSELSPEPASPSLSDIPYTPVHLGSSPDLQRESAPLEPLPIRIGAPITPIPVAYAPSPKPAGSLAQKQLQFTAFYRREVPVETWQTLLVYAHIDDTLQAVREDARRLRTLLDADTLPADLQAAHPLSAGTQITIVPVVQGITFQPERVSFSWTDEWHPITLRFFAEQRLVGSACVGEILVLAGPLVIASLRVALRFAEAETRPEVEPEEVSVTRYNNIFTSYSQNDAHIVQAIRQAYAALGDESFQDIEILRAGQNWRNLLPRAIESADVFQLFWSPNAAQSQIVYQECQYALQHYKYDGFIRPIYWEQPLTFSPPEFAHLHFTYYALPPRLE